MACPLTLATLLHASLWMHVTVALPLGRYVSTACHPACLGPIWVYHQDSISHAIPVCVAILATKPASSSPEHRHSISSSVHQRYDTAKIVRRTYHTIDHTKIVRRTPNFVQPASKEQCFQHTQEVTVMCCCDFVYARNLYSISEIIRCKQ